MGWGEWCISFSTDNCNEGAYSAGSGTGSCPQCTPNDNMGSTCSQSCYCPQHICNDYDDDPPPSDGWTPETAPPGREAKRGGWIV